MTLTRRPRPTLALSATLAASLLAACSQPAQQVASADPTVQATPSPSPTPEPTAAPAEAFVAYLTDGHFTATADISGTLVVNEVSRELMGEWTVSGADFHVVLDFGDGVGTVEQAVVEGQNFVREPSKPWKRDLEASVPSDKDFANVLASLSWAPADEGSAGALDTQLVASGSRVETAMTLLGLVDQSVEVDQGTLTISVDRRGVPTEMHLAAEAHRLAGDPLLFEWDLVYALHDVGRRTTIKEPEAWVPHESDLGYSLLHPESWSVSRQPGTAEYVAYDLFLSPLAGEVHVAMYDGIPPEVPANSLLQEATANFNAYAGAPEETESLTVAGAPALFLATHKSDETGEWWFMQVTIVGVGRAWELHSFSAPGTEDTARQTLDHFLATFEIAES